MLIDTEVEVSEDEMIEELESLGYVIIPPTKSSRPKSLVQEALDTLREWNCPDDLLKPIQDYYWLPLCDISQCVVVKK